MEHMSGPVINFKKFAISIATCLFLAGCITFPYYNYPNKTTPNDGPANENRTAKKSKREQAARKKPEPRNHRTDRSTTKPRPSKLGSRTISPQTAKPYPRPGRKPKIPQLAKPVTPPAIKRPTWSYDIAECKKVLGNVESFMLEFFEQDAKESDTDNPWLRAAQTAQNVVPENCNLRKWTLVRKTHFVFAAMISLFSGDWGESKKYLSYLFESGEFARERDDPLRLIYVVILDCEISESESEYLRRAILSTAKGYRKLAISYFRKANSKECHAMSRLSAKLMFGKYPKQFRHVY